MSLTVNQQALSELRAKLTPFNASKVIFGTLISLGAAAAIFAALRNPLRASKGIIKILMILGVIVLADKAGDVAQTHFENKLDEWKETLSDIKKEIKEEGARTNGDNPNAGRNSEQQPQKSGNDSSTSSAATDKASGSAIRWRWWGKTKGAKQVLEVVPEDVPKRQESS